MSFSPEVKQEIDSPEVFKGIRCNLDSKFLDARESIPNDSMCVYARVRPLLPEEEAKGYKVCVAAIDEKTVRVVVPTNSAKYKSARQTEEIIEDYSFTAAFGPETGQFVFFQETMLHMMSNFVEGSNSLCFSYGITGSGKTYTLQGNSENPGIIPLSLKLYFAACEKQLMKDIVVKPSMYNDVIELSEVEKQKELSMKNQLLSLYDDECENAPGSFRNNNEKSFAMTLCNLFSDDFEMEERQTTLNAEDMASAQAATLLKEVIKGYAKNQPGVCSIWISFIEIYNETIFDLLQPISNQRTKLNLGEDKNGNVYVKGVKEVCVFNSDEALKLLNIGRKNLSIASTKMNYQSSRSHCIYTIRVVRVPDVNNISHARVNRLSFCDLAGSERASKTQTTGVRLKEANAINTSLLVLGRCLEQLRLSQMGRDRRLIPFRESKLTRIFSGFFLGQGKAAMIANASPSDYTFDETLHVLKFSAVAKKIMVNDTFLSNASATIQSICKKWADTSTLNETVESMESDSDLIQEKDELIEKLLSLAQNFAKKEKEFNEMEIRIRREACQEYAEVREELLEMQKLRYEEEIAAIKENYEQRIAKLEKKYEELQDQLDDSTTEESFANDKSLDASKSFEALNDSSRLSLSKSDSADLQKKLEEKNSELESIMKDLRERESELNILKQKYEELNLKFAEIEGDKENLQNDCAAINIKNKALEDIVEKFQKEIEELKSQKAFYEKENKIHKDEIEKLKNGIEAARKEYRDDLRECEAAVNAQFQKEKLKRDNKIQLLEEEIVKLKGEKSSFEKNVEMIERKLSESQEENCKSEKIIHDQCETISTLESEAEILRKEIENLEKRLAELKEAKETTDLMVEQMDSKYQKELSEAKTQLKNYQILYNGDIENKNQKIASLEQELQIANKNADTLQKELKVRETVSMELEKEIDNFKQTVDKLQKELKESISLKHELEKKVTMLREELKLSHDNSQQLSSKLKEVENKNHAYESEIQKLLKNKENFADNNLKLASVEKELSFTKSEVETLREANRRFSNNVEQLQTNVEKLQLENEKYKQLEDDYKKLQKMNENLASEKEDLEKELNSVKNNMENIRKSSADNIRKNQEFEALSKKYGEDLVRWKQEKQCIDSEKEDLKEKLNITREKMKSLEIDIQQKSTKISELENLSKKYGTDLEKLKQEKESTVSQKKELEEKLVAATNTMKSMQQNIDQMSSKILELENQINTYKVETENLKNEREALEAENLELKGEINSYKEKIKEVEENLTSTLKEFNLAKQTSEKSSELTKEIDTFKQEVQKLKEQLQLVEKEKCDLLGKISEREKRIEDTEKELDCINNELKIARNDLNEKNIEMKDFNNKLAQLEKKMTEKTSELDSVVKELENNKSELGALKKNSEKLNLMIKDLESDKENSLKKLADENNDLQEKLKELKTSYENKILLETEQHTVEIEETIKLKREVEKENEKLKEENEKLKEEIEKIKERLKSLKDNETPVEEQIQTVDVEPKSTEEQKPSKQKKSEESKRGTLPKNEPITAKTQGGRVSNKEKRPLSKAGKRSETKETEKSLKVDEKKNDEKEKETLQKSLSTRSLRQKQALKLKDISFSSVDSHESESVTPDGSKRNRKRISDEDFNPAKERATKKMKTVEESKIPTATAGRKTTTRKKLQNEQTENLSPVQKIANSISTRFKAMAENVSSKIASPRVTRGRKRLFNPDTNTATSTKSEKTTRGKK